MSAPTDPYRAERERDRIHRENLAIFDEIRADQRARSSSAGRSTRNYGPDGPATVGAFLLCGAILYASGWIRVRYFPGGDPIYRNLMISMVLILLGWFGLWSFGRIFRSRTAKMLVVVVVVSVWYLSAGAGRSPVELQSPEDVHGVTPTSSGRVVVGSGVAVSADPPARSVGGSPILSNDAPSVRAEPLRVGGNIEQPTKIKHVRPQYPAIAQSARIEGAVIIEAVIAPDGRVQDARLLRSVPLLDQAALEAVKQWEFTPTLLNGVPVPVVMTVTVNFTLDGGPN